MIKRDSPHYANLEYLALGAILCEEASDTASDASLTRAYAMSHILESDLHAEKAKELWAWIMEQQKKGMPISLILVPDKLMGYAIKCEDKWGTCYGTERNIKAICDELSRISDVFFAYEKAKTLFSELNYKDDVETIHVVQQLRDIADGTAKRHPEVVEDVVAMSDALHFYMNTWGKMSPRMSFGIGSVDEVTHGFRAPNVIVIAGRTNTGKSAIWIPIALSNARSGRRVLICSTEMDRNAMIKRILAHISKIQLNTINAIEDGGIDVMVEHEDKLKKAIADMNSLPITMNDRCRTIGEIDALCKQAEANGNPYSMVVIDYIQLLKPTKTFINKTEIPTSIVSSEMREMASARGVAIVALSQLSRAAMTEGKEPELHHLAQSGSLENDADMVFLMHRPEKEDGKHIMLRLAKNRHGGYGLWHLDFYGDTMSYYERRV